LEAGIKRNFDGLCKDFLKAGNFDGFLKKENFDVLYKCFFDDENAKFLFLDIFDGLYKQFWRQIFNIYNQVI